MKVQIIKLLTVLIILILLCHENIVICINLSENCDGTKSTEMHICILTVIYQCNICSNYRKKW